MGPKTLRRLIVAAVVLVLGVVSIFLLQRYQVARMGRSNLVKAADAVKAGDLAKAEDLYLQHVLVFPKDDAAQAAYAKVLMDRSKTPARVDQAIRIYKDILSRAPGEDDVRRRLAELLVESNGTEEAGHHLATLQSKQPDDGDLAYLMGRCQQAEGRDEDAVGSYLDAIAHRAAKRFDARQRAATLYRGSLNKPEEADRIIDEMVKEDPEDFHVYLERGRYRVRVGTSDADRDAAVDDYRQAMKLAPKEPDAYLELALVSLRRTPPDSQEAVRVLREGLEANPKAGPLYLTAARIDLQAGDANAALKMLHRGLEAIPDDAELRVTLAETLAVRGATVELRDQIQELTRLGLRLHAEYYTAYLYVNTRDWAAAKKALQDDLIPALERAGAVQFRSKANLLLAQCYANLSEPERQRAALDAANRDDPNNLAARLTWIAGLAQQGETNRAIDEYRKLAGTVASARLPLIQLLIARDRRLPVPQRDWTEAERLIELTVKDDPSPSRPALLRAQLLEAKGDLDGAAKLLDAARAENPRDSVAVLLWTAAAEVRTQKKDYTGALRLLDEAKTALGDSMELRLGRLKVLSARRAPDLAASLVELAQNLESFPVDKRVTVLNAVGDELTRRNFREDARKVWNQYTEIAPSDARPRIQLLGMAFTSQEDPSLGEGAGTPAGPEDVASQAAEIEANLKALRQIEGSDGYLSRYGDIEFLMWRARHAADPTEKARLRSEARSLLTELRSRRADWSVIPLTTARLEEQELDDSKNPEERKARVDRLADLYRQAVEAGQRNLRVVQKATELLIEAGRTAEVVQLWNKVPILSGDGGDASYLAASILEPAIRDKEYGKAIEIVKQRILARPNDYSQRILLARLLLLEGRPDEAEAELRQAVALDPSDPNRHVILVQFLISTGQIDKAEEVASRIVTAVGPQAAPLAMAAASDMIAQGCQATAQDEKRAQWLDSARDWYAKAQAAKPGEFAVKRAYVEFLLRSNLVVDAEKELTAFLSPPAESQQPAPAESDVAWARRTLALTYVARSETARDYQQALKALNLYAPPGRTDWKPPEESEDLSVLARVYEAQKLIPYRLKAIEILEKLNAAGRATDDDRFLLARLHKVEGRWDEARAEFSRLMQDADKPTSSRDLAQYVIRLVHFTSELINQIKIDKNPADATEAQALIERLRKIQPDGFNVLALQSRLDKATGKDDEAAARIKEIVDRPKVLPALAIATSNLAEELGLFDMAEELLKKNATTSARLEDQIHYAAFLGRRGRVQQALDVCEPLWKSSPNPEPIAPALIGIVLSPLSPEDKSQIERAGGWIEHSLEQKPDSTLLTIALATIRDRQQRYDEAVALYRKAIGLRSVDVIPLNNLAWLMTLQGEKGAAPLELINRAIALRGPVPEFLDTRAVVYLTNGESRRAIEDLENAVAINPSAGRYFHLARAYLEAGDLGAAKVNFDKARGEGLGPDDIHPLERAALAQVEKALK